MKKEYIAPFAVEVDITAENLIATSVPVKEEEGDAGEQNKTVVDSIYPGEVH